MSCAEIVAESPVGVVSDQVFLFSSVKNNPDTFFQGYCFSGKDFIFGLEGQKQFQATYCKPIAAAEDGCYVSVTKQDDYYLFETDYSGYKKLFYYWSADFWAVSNSLLYLAEHMQACGQDIVPNYGQLEAIKSYGGTALRQMTSFHTIIQDVYLVPANCSLRIADGSYELLAHDARVFTESYQTSLQNFIELWVSRMETLLLSRQMSIVSDLTGGLDSRVVFSLLQKGLDRLADEVLAQVKINCGTSPGREKDLEIATLVCQKLNIPLNATMEESIDILSGFQAYNSWKYLNLGAYHPIYFRTGYPDSGFIYFTGGGGENQRLFYGKDYESDFVDKFVESCARRILSKPRSQRFRKQMQETMAYLYPGEEDSIEALLLHYRHFRNRFHAGRAPQHVSMFCPLASASLEPVIQAGGLEKISDAQIHYDIMHALNPLLLDLPFDDPDKTPSEQIRSRLCQVTIGKAANPGRVFRDGGKSEELHTPESGSVFDFLEEEFANLKQKPFVREFCGDEFIVEAEKVLKEASRKGKFRHASDAKPIAAVLAAGIFDA